MTTNAEVIFLVFGGHEKNDLFGAGVHKNNKGHESTSTAAAGATTTAAKRTKRRQVMDFNRREC
jgi:hypothetical protein